MIGAGVGSVGGKIYDRIVYSKIVSQGILIEKWVNSKKQQRQES